MQAAAVLKLWLSGDIFECSFKTALGTGVQQPLGGATVPKPSKGWLHKAPAWHGFSHAMWKTKAALSELLGNSLKPGLERSSRNRMPTDTLRR